VRKSKRLIAILATVALLVTMLIPMSAVPAFAAGTISALSVPTLVDDPAMVQKAGTIKVTVPAGSIDFNDNVIIKLPGEYDFDTAFQGLAVGVPGPASAVNTATLNEVVVPATVGSDSNGLLAVDIEVTVLDENDEVQIKCVNAAGQSLSFDFVFYVYLDGIEVEDGTDKDFVVNFDAAGTSGFPTGDVTAAKCSGTGQVILIPSGQDTSNNDFTIDLRIKEETAGSLELGEETLSLELPSGYVWTCSSVPFLYVAPRWGQGIFVEIWYNTDKDTIYIDLLGADLNKNGIQDAGETTATSEASCWDINGFLKFTVDDEEDCEAGSIIAQVGGDSDTNVSEGPVGTFGEFGSKVSAEDVQEIFAGQEEQEIGNVVIEESLEATLVDGRTVTLTLPDGVAWMPVYASAGDLDDFSADEGLDVNFVSFTGSDDRTAKFTVDSESNDAAKIKLEDCEVAVEAGFEGDVKVTVGGTAGVTGEVVVATVKAPVTATADSTPNIIIGASGPAAGVLTIKENIKEALIEDETLTLDLPPDVEFDGTPTVEVTEGNLDVSNVKRVAGNNKVEFNIDNNSSTPSTIVVSNIKLKVYRTVPEGNIDIKVMGDAVVETDGYDLWTNSDYAAKTAIAVCATPAPSDEKATVVFKINDTSYTVNGVAQTMDVAPYLKGGRTFLPVRYVAQACGVSADNILFSNGKVTLIKGDKVVQMTIGSKVMIINGASIDMDVAAEISNGRTMLPFRFIAQALGASVTFDDTAQTVTMVI
jgi:hypothetical protein